MKQALSLKPNPSIRVWLMDDEEYFLQAMAMEFADWEDFTLSTFDATSSFLAELGTTGNPPHIVLLDINIPGSDGISLLQPIKARSPLTRVLMLTSSDNDRNIRDALKQGADGYLLKGVSIARIVESIRECLQGGVPIDARAASKILRGSSGTDEPRGAVHLTEKEHCILKLMAEGLSYASIAQETATRVKTVSSHVENIFRKLGVHSRSEAIALAIKERLLQG
jgi:DNA-binding NarL/FixJ family response regulator